jgi:hypothetical protein
LISPAAAILASQLDPHLADRFQERQRLDVAHRAADLDDRQLRLARAAADEMLDFVRDMRNDLDGAAEVVAPALLLDHALIDLAGGEIVALRHLGMQEALVMAEIEVGLGAVLGDEDFTVLERAHGPRIHVEIGIQLDHRDLETTGLEDGGQ